jgi:hypothetical protein
LRLPLRQRATSWLLALSDTGTNPSCFLCPQTPLKQDFCDIGCKRNAWSRADLAYFRLFVGILPRCLNYPSYI